MLLLIDNYDSFTYNLYQYLSEFVPVVVYRNDQITIEDIEKMKPDGIVISPGPSVPERAGISVQVIRHFKDRLPILGVCLGHQALAYAFGTKIIKTTPMHGKVSEIYHIPHPLFDNVENPFIATRYHSLVADYYSLSEKLKIIAWTKDKIIMGLQYEDYPVFGVQFHPESAFTPKGKEILKNFLKIGGLIK